MDYTLYSSDVYTSPESYMPSVNTDQDLLFTVID